MLAGVIALALAQSGLFDQGTFTTYLSGGEISTEGFRMLESGKSSSLISTKTAGGSKLSVKTELLVEGGRVSSATVNIVSVRTYRLQRTPEGHLVDSGGKRIADAQRSVFCVEPYAWHQISHLLRAYEGSTELAYDVIAPSLGEIHRWTVLKSGALQDTSGELQRWQLSMNGRSAMLVSDRDGRVLYVEIPDQKLEVVRKGYERLRTALSAPTPRPDLQPNREKYREQEIRVLTSANVLIAGSLMVPVEGGRHPGVFMIGGSGPSDRDWDSQPSLTMGMGLQIADALAGAGYVVLRFDDRGVGRSTGPKGQSFAAAVADSRSLANYLKSRSEVDPFRVYILGHSEGAVAALKLLAEDAWLKGGIFIGCPSKSLDRVLLEQLNAQQADDRLPQAIRDQASAKIPKVTEAIAKATAGEAGSVDGIELAWLREHMNLDPTKLASQVSDPVLLVQGLEDLQVLSRNAAELKAAFGEKATVEYVPGATHYLAPFPYGVTAASPEDQGKVSPGALSAIVGWLKSRG